MIDYHRLAGPLLRLLPPEAAHGMTIRALAAGLVPVSREPDDPILACRLWGRSFANPLGLAAGFDKNAEVADAMLALGFGFVEVGTVTPRPQPGNPGPRLFRLKEDEAIINRLGFNSAGQDIVVRRLRRRRQAASGASGVTGVNISMNADSADPIADYVSGVRAFAGLADYLVINVSSPNTPGLRELQDRGRLAGLLAQVQAALAAAKPSDTPPLVLKIAPDLTPDERRDIAGIALERAVDGLIVANTTTARPEGLKSRRRGEPGGLSGRPLLPLATEVLSDMYRLTGGGMPLVGVGGVASGRDAYAKIRAGATLVQLYTALVYQGSGLIARIKRELAAHLRADGFTAVAQAVGADHR